MGDHFNSQENFDGVNGVEETYDGEQEGVVDSQESQYVDNFDFGGDGQESVVDSQEESGEEEDFEEGANAPAVAEQGRVRNQTREDNAAARMARIHARREADEEIAGMGLKNHKGEPIRNMAELKAFGKERQEEDARRIAKMSGRSVNEVLEEIKNRDFVRKMRESDEAKNAAMAAAATAATAQQAFIAKDVRDFMAKHPNVDMNKLGDNPRFREFCGSRLGREPLANLYESYMKLTGEAESAGRAGAQSRKSRSTGSGGGGGGVLTPSQRASLDAWNRENPDMKMTAKEFLGR